MLLRHAYTQSVAVVISSRAWMRVTTSMRRAISAMFARTIVPLLKYIYDFNSTQRRLHNYVALFLTEDVLCFNPLVNFLPLPANLNVVHNNAHRGLIPSSPPGKNCTSPSPRWSSQLSHGPRLEKSMQSDISCTPMPSKAA